MSNPAVLTTNEVLVVNAALLSFEASKEPYALSDKCRYGLVRNIARLKAAIAEINDAREALRIVYNPRNLKLAELTEEKQAAWDTAHLDLMKEHRDPITFHVIKLSAFQLDKNPSLPHSVVATLISSGVVEDDIPPE